MSKQSLYQKILAVVEAGHIAITQNEETERFNLFSSMFGNWIRCTGSFDSLKDCYNHLGEHYLTEGEIDIAQQGGERYIGIYERPLWRPKVGDKVQVLQRVIHTPNRKYLDNASNVPGGVFEVTYLSPSGCDIEVGVGADSFVACLPYDCIAPRVEIDE